MYCAKCGASVNGKFCCVCGTKIRTDIQEYRLAVRRKEKSFRESASKNSGLYGLHIADACWYACESKYGRDEILPNGELSPYAYLKLESVELNARKLFEAIINLR